jgi:2'-deoxymugineic-acid 2'-dioxygenase / mugineic-acid 3-dioxygenase
VQVVNHGVPEQVMQDMEVVCEFFRLPAEDKAHLYSESADRHRTNRIFTGATYETDGEQYWRDCLRAPCPPLPCRRRHQRLA